MLTAAKRPGKPAVGHDELSAMATGAMLCWLTGDTYVVGRINDEIENLDSLRSRSRRGSG